MDAVGGASLLWQMHLAGPSSCSTSCRSYSDGACNHRAPPGSATHPLLAPQVAQGLDARDAWAACGKPNGKAGIRNIRKQGRTLRTPSLGCALGNLLLQLCGLSAQPRGAEGARAPKNSHGSMAPPGFAALSGRFSGVYEGSDLYVVRVLTHRNRESHRVIIHHSSAPAVPWIGANTSYT